MNTWKEKFKEALDMKTVALIMLILWTLGEKVWGWVEVGAEVEFQNKIIKAYQAPAVKDAVKKEFESNITDPVMLHKILNTPTLDEFTSEAGDKIQKKIVQDVLTEDSTKISTVSFLGKETGMRDETILPTLAKLLKAYEKGEIMTKAEIEEYTQKQLRIARF
jgi:hypothetical protein